MPHVILRHRRGPARDERKHGQRVQSQDVSQLAPHGLIDEYQVVVCPVVLGRGRTMFEGIMETLALKRTEARGFTNGNVLLRYESMR